jgi:hypothetical protein
MTGVSTLTDRLVADLRPVRRLRPAVVLAVCVLLQAVVLATVVAAWRRPDLRHVLGEPLYLFEVAACALLAAGAAWLAALAAIPDRAPRAGWLVLLVVLALAALGPFADGAPGPAVGAGVGCVVGTILIAALPWAVLVLVLRAGAPVAPATAGTLAGAAAFLVGAAGMRLVCPQDTSAHLVPFHVLPVLLGVAASAALGAVWLGRWGRGGAARVGRR